MTEQREPGEPRRPVSSDDARRLERAPAERYAQPAAEIVEEPSVARGITVALLVALGGAAIMVLLAGQLAVSSGLVIMALIIGRFVGLGLRMTRGALSPGRARALAGVIAIAGIVIAQVGIWLYARSEGGVLELADYLGQTFGLLVPLEILLAAVVAVVSAD